MKSTFDDIYFAQECHIIPASSPLAQHSHEDPVKRCRWPRWRAGCISCSVPSRFRSRPSSPLGPSSKCPSLSAAGWRNGSFKPRIKDLGIQFRTMLFLEQNTQKNWIEEKLYSIWRLWPCGQTGANVAFQQRRIDSKETVRSIVDSELREDHLKQSKRLITFSTPNFA